MGFRVGLAAIALSFVPWMMIAAAPLLGLSLGASAGLVTGLAVGAEVLFWAGLALAGKDTWQTIKARGWRGAPRELGRLLVHGRPQASHPVPGVRRRCARPAQLGLTGGATRVMGSGEPRDESSRPSQVSSVRWRSCG